MTSFSRCIDAVELAALNLAGHLENLERLPKQRPPETVALHRSHLADLQQAARLLRALASDPAAVRAIVANAIQGAPDAARQSAGTEAPVSEDPEGVYSSPGGSAP